MRILFNRSNRLFFFRIRRFLACRFRGGLIRQFWNFIARRISRVRLERFSIIPNLCRGLEELGPRILLKGLDATEEVPRIILGQGDLLPGGDDVPGVLPGVVLGGLTRELDAISLLLSDVEIGEVLGLRIIITRGCLCDR